MSCHIITVFLTVLLCLSPVGGLPARAVTFETMNLPPSAAAPPVADPGFGELPLYFVPNRGQTDPHVAFYLLGGGTQIWFARDGVTFAISQPAPADAPDPYPVLDRTAEPVSEPESSARWTVKLDFVGANPAAQSGARTSRQPPSPTSRAHPTSGTPGCPPMPGSSTAISGPALTWPTPATPGN